MSNYIGQTNWADGPYFKGQISEFIVFNTSLSITEVQKVESYLSLKYGKTLSQSSGFQDYLASDGSSVWANDDDGYDQNIFGLGRDDNSGLNQKISKAEDVGTIVNFLTLSLDSDFTSPNSSALRSGTHTNNLQYLILADNG